jgi:ubiquinone/menaquinone biosynthesis C-methylase UbiE
MSFDLLAPVYRWLEIICAGEKMHRCRTAFLDEIPPPEKILLLGEGHGRALAECRRRFDAAQITCVDASEKMLYQARRQLQRENLDAYRVEWIQADILAWSPPAKTYDLIVTNFFFDCFRPDQLAQMIPRIASGATPDANWLLADFQIPAAGLKRFRARLILRLLYIFFRLTTCLSASSITKPGPFLRNAGFTLHRRRESEWDLLHTDWWIMDKPTTFTVPKEWVA